MIPLKDLLGHALKRAHVSTQVSASQLVSSAEDFLVSEMGARKRDARAVSFQNGILTIETRHSAASQFLKDLESPLKAYLQERRPELPVRSVRYRVVHRFRRADIL